MNAVSIRGDWVGQKIDGKFPLIAWLGGSGTSGVFVTEIEDPGQKPNDLTASAPGLRRAAIKLLPATGVSEERLAVWTSTAALSHPHLVRVLKSGRAAIDGVGLIYVVTELADEVLAQIIPERPLTPDETREMAGPVLDALAYLHGNGYVHGHLKPSNIVVVEDGVKLSSDSLIPVGSRGDELPTSDFHSAPEMASGPITPAADVWSLGTTLVEVLTQQHPIWDAAADAEAQVPASLPRPFAEIVRECLQIDPARRCSLKDIRNLLEGKPRLTVVPRAAKPQEVLREPVEEKQKAKIPLIPIIVGLVLLIAVIIGLRMRSHATNTAPVQTEATQQAPAADPDSHSAAPQPNPSQPAATQPAPGGTARAEVVDRVMPDVSRSASNTIQGKVSVAVRITVDATGAVSNAELTSHGPSAYFARIALESARKWKFKPAQQNGRPVESTWMLRYAFRRSGTDVTPEQIAP
jgi:TonB family protein